MKVILGILICVGLLWTSYELTYYGCRPKYHYNGWWDTFMYECHLTPRRGFNG
jgi:hypothetical protein